MTEPLNKVTIPMKSNLKKASLEELKANLLKHLPRIVRVDEAGCVALQQCEKKRIGRVLPWGQGGQATSVVSSNDTSRCYQLRQNLSDTFVS